GAGIPLIAPTVTDVWAGIDRVYQLLKDFRLVIHDSCPMLLSQLGDYRRKLKAGEPTDKIEDKEK
ncbi:MAG: terminase, partial [Anaerolineae bacterium]|nr:terminase [Anaerolineae bacterium]